MILDDPGAESLRKTIFTAKRVKWPGIRLWSLCSSGFLSDLPHHDSAFSPVIFRSEKLGFNPQTGRQKEDGPPTASVGTFYTRRQAQEASHRWHNMSPTCQYDTQLLIILVSYLLTACHKHHLQSGTPEARGKAAHPHFSLFSLHTLCPFLYLLLNSAFISAAWLAPFVGGKQYSLYTRCRFPQGGFALVFSLIISIMYETWLYKMKRDKNRGWVVIRLYDRCVICSNSLCLFYSNFTEFVISSRLWR